MQYLEISPTIRINYTIHQPSPSPSSSTSPRPRPWIILINGLADPQTTWAAQVSAFTSAGYTVLTYDNRGIGLSSRPSRPDERWTAEDMASDLRALVTTLDIPRPYHILGISMGGMIAQTYALNYCCGGNDSSVELFSLMLCCTYAAPGPFCSRMFGLWGDMARQMSVSDVMRDVLLWCFTPEWFADPASAFHPHPGRQGNELAEIEAEMAKMDEEMGREAYLAQLNVITSFDTRKQVGKLAGLKAHVNVLVGEQDILIPNVVSAELADLVDGSYWEVTEGGHACNWEYPDKFNESVLERFDLAEEKKGL